jgi:hypothetical protein
MRERYELLKGGSPLLGQKSGQLGAGEQGRICLTAGPAAAGSLAARSTIRLAYLRSSCMLEDDMFEVSEDGTWVQMSVRRSGGHQ